MALTYHREMHTKSGASRVSGLAAGSEPRVSLHRLLQPQMYPKNAPPPLPTVEERAAMIVAYLKENKRATVPTMAAAFGLSHDAVSVPLRKGIEGVVTKRTESAPGYTRKRAVWELDIHTDDSDE